MPRCTGTIGRSALVKVQLVSPNQTTPSSDDLNAAPVAGKEDLQRIKLIPADGRCVS